MAGSPLSAARDIRFRWYKQVEERGKTVPEICGIFGISKKTYYKWHAIDHGRGPKEYKSRSSHPQLKITGNVRVMLVEAKRRYNYGPQKMQLYLEEHAGISVSTTAIYKFMKKRGLIKKPQKKQAWYLPLKEPFHASKPGENVQFDVKYVPDGQGYWLYQYRLIDTVTNIQYCVNSELRDARATIRAFSSAERAFLFPITGIQTDNGGEFRGDFHLYLVRRGITHRFIPKRSAPWNGKVERANRSVDDEFYLNFNRPWKRLCDYTQWYNFERYHLGKEMNGQTPYQKFLSLTADSSPLKGN